MLYIYIYYLYQLYLILLHKKYNKELYRNYKNLEVAIFIIPFVCVLYAVTIAISFVLCLLTKFTV